MKPKWPYGIRFDFDGIGDPPAVYIAEDEGDGTAVMEIFEEPEWIGGEKRVHISYEYGPEIVLAPGLSTAEVIIKEEPVDTEDPWSNDSDDWRAGPMAMDVLAFMNSRRQS